MNILKKLWNWAFKPDDIKYTTDNWPELNKQPLGKVNSASLEELQRLEKERYKPKALTPRKPIQKKKKRIQPRQSLNLTKKSDKIEQKRESLIRSGDSKAASYSDDTIMSMLMVHSAFNGLSDSSNHSYHSSPGIQDTAHHTSHSHSCSSGHSGCSASSGCSSSSSCGGGGGD